MKTILAAIIAALLTTAGTIWMYHMTYGFVTLTVIEQDLFNHDVDVLYVKVRRSNIVGLSRSIYKAPHGSRKLTSVVLSFDSDPIKVTQTPEEILSQMPFASTDMPELIDPDGNYK